MLARLVAFHADAGSGAEHACQPSSWSLDSGHFSAELEGDGEMSSEVAAGAFRCVFCRRK